MHGEKTLVIFSYIAVSPHHPITVSIEIRGAGLLLQKRIRIYSSQKTHPIPYLKIVDIEG
jgi:hypothetical protein